MSMNRERSAGCYRPGLEPAVSTHQLSAAGLVLFHSARKANLFIRILIFNPKRDIKNTEVRFDYFVLVDLHCGDFQTHHYKMSSRLVQLSPFQKEKLEYYFRFLAPDEEGNLDKNSINRLMEKILDFTGWDEDSPTFREFQEVHEAFFEQLFERAQEEEGEAGKVTLDNWLSMWSSILPGVMSMHNLPVWLRLMPQLLFKIVDRRRQKYLTANDLEIFYKEMVHLDSDQAFEVAQKAYSHMTDEGRYPLNEDSYEQLFANFLIGRTPYGPGRYIFGCFEHEVRPFQLIAPAPDEDESVMEVRKPVSGRRPSRQFSYS
ncbi:hypothetical protein Btru_023121 [Bulinus truncatus]|nr:hypothetical protein Btru_023121 [Bulinus truncatus]